MLSRKSELRCLDLSENELANEGAKAIAGGLKQLTSIQSLDMTGNQVWPSSSRQNELVKRSSHPQARGANEEASGVCRSEHPEQLPLQKQLQAVEICSSSRSTRMRSARLVSGL